MKRFTVILTLLIAMMGCADQGPVKRSWGRMKGLDKLVGNMNDTSYSKTRGKSRRSAAGNYVSFSRYRGKFIWVEYDATWCSVCTGQVARTKAALNQFDDVEFLTVMTAKGRSYNDVPTVDTAKSWATRHGLKPSKVLVAKKLWAKMIPEHRLLSPEGHTLFVHVGGLHTQQIVDVINYYKGDWERWAEGGSPAKWMTFQ